MRLASPPARHPACTAWPPRTPPLNIDNREWRDKTPMACPPSSELPDHYS
jgi:hypothetical protein